MSNSTDTTGCLSHRRQTRFFIMYEDFLDVAKVSEHQYKLAAYWRVLETKTNDRITSIPEIAEDCKKKGVPIPEEHLWIEIPYSEFVNRSLGTYKSSSFQVAAAESERLGFSKSRQLKRRINPNDPNSPMEDYKEYLFLSDVMQSVLNGGEYPPPIEINSPLLNSIATRKKAKKEKTPIEINTPPIEINSPPTVTPIEINSPPLLNSIGNKYINKDTKDNRKNEGTGPREIDATQTHISSLTHSSAPSSSLEQLSTELSPRVEKASPIASPTTENAEPRTIRKTDELQPALNLEEVRARGYWNRLGFIEKAASAKHWKTLAEHTKTFEQFESLFEYTRVQIEKDPRITKKEVNPGNMVREITGWKQEENRKLAQRVQPEQTRPMSLAERNREKMRMAGITTAAVTGRN